MKNKIIALLLIIILIDSSSCVVHGPVRPRYHHYMPHRYWLFPSWQFPFSYPYTKQKRKPGFYWAPKYGKRKARNKRWIHTYVPKPPYYKKNKFY